MSTRAGALACEVAIGVEVALPGLVGLVEQQLHALTRFPEPLVGDVRSATTLLHECVETTAATRGRVAAQRIGRARRELAPWRTELFVAELDDHIYDVMLAI